MERSIKKVYNYPQNLCNEQDFWCCVYIGSQALAQLFDQCDASAFGLSYPGVLLLLELCRASGAVEA